MKESAYKYYSQGYNCCEAIIMSACDKYKIRISTDSFKLASGINNGMGIGNMCGAIIGGVMIIGVLFEKKCPPCHSQTNHIRMKFISTVGSQIGEVNCAAIIKLPLAKGNCANVVANIAEILEKVIEEFI